MIDLLNHPIPILCLNLVRTPRKSIINYTKNFYRNYLVIILLDFYIKVDNDQKKKLNPERQNEKFRFKVYIFRGRE